MNLNDLSHGLPTCVVPREQTQALLDQRAAAAGLIKPKDRYTLADRLEHQAREQGERTFLIATDLSCRVDAGQSDGSPFMRACAPECLRPGHGKPSAFFCTWFGLVKLGGGGLHQYPGHRPPLLHV
jgi:fatty-acyl-CoA synthase